VEAGEGHGDPAYAHLTQFMIAFCHKVDDNFRDKGRVSGRQVYTALASTTPTTASRGHSPRFGTLER
jgi:hypothetical protein